MERMMGCNFYSECVDLFDHVLLPADFVIYIHGLEQLIELSHQDP